jgi:integrase
VSPHDLRHTFGHRWLVKGGSVDDLSFILGHSDSRITRKHYAHLLDTDLAAKMRAVMEAASSLGYT